MGIRSIAGVLLLFSWFGAGVRAQSPSVAEQYLFQAANAERASRGLQTLRWDPVLYRAALAHAQQMASRASISHQYPGEAELATRGKQAGARFSLISENVAEAMTAVRIHDAWMNSPGHRANLLDPHVDSVAISVLQRDGQLYAVQDFERSVTTMSLQEQEQAVGRLVATAGRIGVSDDPEDARQTCALKSGYGGARQPGFLTRFTSGDLLTIPDTLKAQIASGEYREAAIGACTVAGSEPFTSYNIAVMLYR